MAEDRRATVDEQRARTGAGTDSLTALAPGTHIGKYQILGALGQGGFSITYRAIDTQLDREVAIKEYLPANFAVRQPDFAVLPRSTGVADDFLWGRERFLNEAKTLARLTNAPGVVDVFDYLEAFGTAYMVMALVRGDTLEVCLKRHRRLSQPAIELLLFPLLDGLEIIHQAGFLHRDIKPANILIDSSGRPTLIDFGAARLALHGRTQAMTAVYTLGYAAPEQMTPSAKQGPWTDIYALAGTLYHCVTGETPPSAIERLTGEPMIPASEAGKGRYGPSLLSAIDAGLKLKAAERPQSIAEWRTLLGVSPSMATNSDGPATRRMDAAAMAHVPTRRGTRAHWPVWLTAAVLVLCVAGGVYVLQRGEEAVKEPPPRYCPACPEMVRIPTGSFTMGSSPNERDRQPDEGPQHRVTIGYAFSLGKYEVTRGEFAAFVQATGHRAAGDWRNPEFTPTDRDPVVNVSWNDAEAYVAWLVKTTGKQYRLPSEAEWEYAARAGTATARYWGDRHQDACKYANVDDASHGCRDGHAKTAPVGKFQPNSFGLYDMLGNVWEWTEDCWNGNYDGAPANGSSWVKGDCSRRVLRGGSWDNDPWSVHAASRLRHPSGLRYNSIGFRVARTD